MGNVFELALIITGMEVTRGQRLQGAIHSGGLDSQ